jgi:DNA invertase Pin-like site-specific DNA recombinase
MRVGYVMVSTVDQNTVRQLDGIRVARTFTDTVSGTGSTRPKLDELIAVVRDATDHETPGGLADRRASQTLSPRP